MHTPPMLNTPNPNHYSPFTTHYSPIRYFAIFLFPYWLMANPQHLGNGQWLTPNPQFTTRHLAIFSLHFSHFLSNIL
jgi:hypothetical protein